MKTIILMLILAFTAFAQCEDKQKFSKLSPDKKAEVWKAHFADVLAGDKLTDIQRNVIYKAVKLSNSVYVKQDKEAITSLTNDINSAFTKAEARRVFEQPYWTDPIIAIDCDCNPTRSWCDHCDTGSGCATTDGGCGVFWLYICSGTCKDGATN